MHLKILILLLLGTFYPLDIMSTSQVVEVGIMKNKAFIISTTLRLGQDASIEMADKKAFNYSAETVLKRRFGIDIESTVNRITNADNNFFNKILNAHVDGSVKKYEIADKNIRIENKDIYIDYTYKIWIRKAEQRDEYFSIQAGTDKLEYENNENMTLQFKSDFTDCYLYLYNYYDNKVKLLLNKEIFKGNEWTKNSHVRFEESCNSDIEKSFEHLIFVALKKDIDVMRGEKEVSYKNFIKLLSDLPRDDYEKVIISYVVKK